MEISLANSELSENSLTNTRVRTLEEDQSLIESKRKKSRLEKSSTIHKKEVPKNHQSAWTKEDTNTLIRLKRPKKGWAKIGEELGRSVDDVKKHYWATILNAKVTSSGSYSKDSWTEEEDQKLIKYRSEGKTWREVGNLIGRSELSASSRYRAICEKNAKFIWTEEKKAQLIRYHSEGKEWREIGLLLAVTSKQASQYYDVICNRIWTKEEDAQLIQSRSEGKKWMEIEKELGRDTAVLQDRFKALSKDTLSNEEPSKETLELPQENFPRHTKVDNFLAEMENLFQELS